MIEQQRQGLAGGAEALVDRAVATRRTLMSLLPQVDGETGAHLDAAMTHCDQVIALSGDLARLGGGDLAFMWVDDLREIDDMVSSIYAHIKAEADGTS